MPTSVKNYTPHKSFGGSSGLTYDCKRLEPLDELVLDMLRGLRMVIGQQRVSEGGNGVPGRIQLLEVRFRKSLVVIQHSNLQRSHVDAKSESSWQTSGLAAEDLDGRKKERMGRTEEVISCETSLACADARNMLRC